MSATEHCRQEGGHEPISSNVQQKPGYNRLDEVGDCKRPEGDQAGYSFLTVENLIFQLSGCADHYSINLNIW
jgi:hypothetical protein